ncbi:MAG: DUF3160 domain-containing protein [Candidatus Desulforudis sp.]|nr:DUF3160 domain-containing protein [Bacillota bacterium]MBU4553665.1 DUF3160 domain-containing protein [Bacillota bacterium]MBV1728233.1 DUF3160 domain-containing protein [Desulforudis sp.]MBV1735243.1 DUF3160 domain-containing protein [Desulforudis sp.]MBV1769153.1 DUF3160 domain-containing protein [Desulforudis sp.]
MRIKRTATVGICALVLVLTVVFTGCQSQNTTGPETDAPLISLTTLAAAFAPYKEIPANVKPSVKPYQVDPDLGNVINKDHFRFSPVAAKLLARNGFVVVTSKHHYEFFPVYEMNRYEEIPAPNFVTTDAMLHNYHLFFSHLLRTLEKDRLRPELQALTASMLAGSEKQFGELKGTAWENAAKRNVAFFAVATRLLDPNASVPSSVRQEVEQELRLIAEHQAMMVPSPVMNLGSTASSPLVALNEDYTQYIPRGHYAKSEDLQTYFKAMMWYGRMTFRAQTADETRSAALITLLLSREKDFESWNRIYEPTNFFVGKSDDLGFVQYYEELTKTYDGVPSLKQLIGDDDQWTAFWTAVKKLEPPAINSMPIFDEAIQPDREREIKGFRFMGQRFTLDASVFQRLVYREVGENSEGQRRMLPNGLDIPAAMGSAEAYAILEDLGETDYAKYPENMRKMQSHIASLDTATRTQNLYWSWLHTLAPLTEPKGKGYPSFMTNQAWTRKQLETYLGSWAELKHDTILYAKQVYAEAGGGGEPVDDRGYVEPNPVVFARLAALTRMTVDGLESRGLLDERDKVSLERMEELALQLKTMAEKELSNELLSDEEFNLIRGFGVHLEHFWLEALRDVGVDHRSALYENPASLIADVATDPNGQVLEVGTGYISEIYAVVPVDGKLRIARGAVYSYYEFPWPPQDRLTDEKWRVMLAEDQAPPQPAWTKAYTVTRE